MNSGRIASSQCRLWLGGNFSGVAGLERWKPLHVSDSIAVVDSGRAGNDRGEITCSVVASVCHVELPSEVTVAAHLTISLACGPQQSMPAALSRGSSR